MNKFVKYLYILVSDESRKGFFLSLARGLLFFLSLVYGAAIFLLRFLAGFNRFNARAKVIGIGNITVGGTGKTALTEYIARYLKDNGHKSAIIIRGYKRRISRVNERTAFDYDEMGDEAYMLRRKISDVPIMVDKDRIRSAKKAVRDYNADTLILDDAFQQWKINKSLEIVTVDAGNPFGNRHIIPRGILREPMASLKRADIFVITKTNISNGVDALREELSRINPKAMIAEASYEPAYLYSIVNRAEQHDISLLKNRKIAIFCGIADPESFYNLVSMFGSEVGSFFRFEDHHHYTEKDLEYIYEESLSKGCSLLLTTEKDASRLQKLVTERCKIPILVLVIKLEIKDEKKFHDRLLRIYAA